MKIRLLAALAVLLFTATANAQAFITNTDGWSWYPSPTLKNNIQEGKVTHEAPTPKQCGASGACEPIPDSLRGYTKMTLSQCGTAQDWPSDGSTFMFSTGPQQPTNPRDAHTWKCDVTPSCNMTYHVWNLPYVNPQNRGSFWGVQGIWISNQPITCHFWGYRTPWYLPRWTLVHVTVPAGALQIYQQIEENFWPPHYYDAWSHLGLLIGSPAINVAPTATQIGAYETSFGHPY